MPTLRELSALVGGKVTGDASTEIDGIAPVGDATERQITYITDKHYLARLPVSRAGAVLVGPGMDAGGKPAVEVPDPQAALLVLLKAFAPAGPEVPRGVHPTAVVHPDAKIAPGASVGPHAVIESGVVIGEGTRVGALCFIGWGSSIGKDCRLHPLVTVYERVAIGNSVLVHSGTVIGADGFGFIPGRGEPVKIPQIGRVVIEDNVEIGANTCIDRAMSGVTLIKSGVKIDNQVQIAHNDVIGENTIIAGQTGIGGTTTLGRNVLVGGKVGIVDHVTLGDGAMVAALSGIHNSVPAGTTMYGYPAREAKEGLRLHAEIARLPHLTKRVRALEARLAELEKKAGG